MLEHVRLESARTEDQLATMERIVEDEVCPFCPEQLEKYHKKPILRQGDHWTVTESQWPYKNTAHHFLLISQHHIQHLQDIPAGGFEEMGEHLKWLTFTFNIAYGALVQRFGGTENNGASVAHLHTHLIQALPDLSPEEKVRVKISH